MVVPWKVHNSCKNCPCAISFSYANLHIQAVNPWKFKEISPKTVGGEASTRLVTGKAIGYYKSNYTQLKKTSVISWKGHNSAKIAEITKACKFAPGHLMTIIMWKVGWNPLRNVGAVAFWRKCSCSPNDVRQSNNQTFPLKSMLVPAMHDKVSTWRDQRNLSANLKHCWTE